MEELSTMYHFINDTYVAYISLLIFILDLIHIRIPFIGVFLGNLFIYAYPFSRLLRDYYLNTILSAPNILYTFFVSSVVTFVTQDWTETDSILVILLILMFSVFSASGREKLRGRTIQHELDKFRD